MPRITYFTAIPPVGMVEQITTLATGDDRADIARLAEQARGLGWNVAEVSKWRSDSLGAAVAADGKDVYRHHVRLWANAVMISGEGGLSMGNPISRCMVQLHSIRRDMDGNATLTLRRGRFESAETDVVEMTPNGDQDIVFHLGPGQRRGALDPGRHFYLDLVAVDEPEMPDGILGMGEARW